MLLKVNQILGRRIRGMGIKKGLNESPILLLFENIFQFIFLRFHSQQKPQERLALQL
jgi:hypothetical protein